MENKGILRLIEAVLAVLIVIGVLFFISVGTKVQKQEDLTKVITPMLDEIAKNNSIRNDVLVYNFDNSAEDNKTLEYLEKFVGRRLGSRALKDKVRICPTLDLCPIEPYPGNVEVYAVERIISADATGANFSPRKIKIFLWSG